MKLKFAACIILACFATFIVSCQLDDDPGNEETTHYYYGVKESKITLQDLEGLPNAMRIVNKINDKNSDSNKRNVYNEEYDFFVNTDNILRIDNGNYHSLTFPVFRLEDNGHTENLVLSSEDNGEYTAYLYTYDLTQQEESDLKNEKPTLITNKIKREKINFDTRQLSQRMIQIWYTEVVVIPCGSGEHNAQNFGNWHTCRVTQKPKVMVITRSVLIDDGGTDGWIDGGSYSGGGGSGGGGGGGGSVYNPNIPTFNPDKDLALIKGNLTRPLIQLPTDEQNFYNNDLGGNNIYLRDIINNEDIREPILEYLYENNYSEESRKQAIEILKTISDGGEVDFDNKIILDKSFVEHQKAKCVYDKMQNINAVKKALQPFDTETPVVYLKFTMASLPSGVRAETSEPDSNNIITITLNNNQSNDGVDYQPTTLVAQTIIHEIIHAEFFRQIMIAIGNGSYDEDPIVIRDALANSEYTKLYEYYRTYKDWSHNYMAEHYRRAIARVTQEYATGTAVNGIPNQLYTNLAWRGLMDYELVKAWKDIVDSDPSPTGTAAQIQNEVNTYIITNANQPCI